ncbi:MAG: sulfotransferase family protein [Saprospiraceae bacterium]
MSKIFCIGFQKTGTTSLGKAFTMLGYRVCGVTQELLPALRVSDFEKIKEYLQSYDVCKDNPWPVLFRQLDEYFPDSKFILTHRNEDTWIKSVVNHFDSKPSDMNQYIYGVSFPKGHEERFLNRYREHTESVLNFFKDRQDDLLVINLEDGATWEKICFI